MVAIALSNWDTFALNQDSEPIRGYTENIDGVGIEIYKNWIYIHDRLAKYGVNQVQPQAFDAEYANGHYGYTGDVVAEFQHGELIYGKWHIYAERGPKNGVYVVAESHKYTEDKNGKPQQVDIEVMVGCGVYGFLSDFEVYREELEAVGINPDTIIEEDNIWTMSSTDDDGNSIVEFQKVIKEDEDVRLETIYSGPEKETVFVGVEQADVEFLQEVIQRAKEYLWTGKESIEAIDLSKGLRFNPGDAYFADHLDVDADATKVGEAQEPLLTRALRKNEA